MPSFSEIERENEMLQADLEEAHATIKSIAVYIGVDLGNEEFLDTQKATASIIDGIDRMFNMSQRLPISPELSRDINHMIKAVHS